MPTYVLNRKFTLRSTQGRIINFLKGEPVYVPPQCELEAVAIGAERADGGTKPDVTPDEGLVAKEAPTGDARLSLINQAFAALEKRNAREDFTAAGIPSVRSMREVLGFPIDGKELGKAWYDYRERDTIK